jgi:hypothetical protein
LPWLLAASSPRRLIEGRFRRGVAWRRIIVEPSEERSGERA